MTTSETEQKCDGCSEAASSFQCPLCQAELITDRGFFCSQGCFAKNWLQHRSAFHRSGVVRAKTRREGVMDEADREGQIAKKKRKAVKVTDEGNKDSGEGQSQSASLHQEYKMIPWKILERSTPAQVEPSLSIGIPRATIASVSSDRRVSFWSAAYAAAQHIVAELSNAPRKRREDSGTPLHVLVVASDALAAHAMAWAGRCCGLANVTQLVVEPPPTEGDKVSNPSEYFSGEQRVVVTTQEIVRATGDGSIATWLPKSNNLLITLPGVADATDFQLVHTRALFFTYAKGSTVELGKEEGDEEEATHRLKPSSQVPAGLHRLFEPVQENDMEGTNGVKGRGAKLFLFDNNVSTALSRGDLRGAVQHLVRLYSATRGKFEEVLVNSFMASLGASSVAHAHHTLAYTLRELVDHSTRFKAPQGGTLKDMAIRAIPRVVKLLPPIGVGDGDTGSGAATHQKLSGSNQKNVPQPSELDKRQHFNHYVASPNLQLQATLCYLYPHLTAGVVDALGAAWGIKKILKGPVTLQEVDKERVNAVRRLQNRYGTKLGPACAGYLVVLMHFLYDAVACYSLSLDDVERRTLWHLTLEGEVGPMPDFLSNCFLLQEDAVVPNEKNDTLSSRQKPLTANELIALRRKLPVRTASAEAKQFLLPWVDLPLVLNRQRKIQQLQQQAVEEILMAMPRKPRPMYIGDVGNLVGRWFRFNARFEGTLGVSLMDFLIQHPEAFRVVGNLVTRRKAGTCDPVPIHFNDDSGDEDEDGNDESEKSRKAKDRAMLTGASNGRKGGAGREMPARARKRAAVKAFNKSRFNRNYKPLDPSAKVPGYVRHRPRKVKGRGRKANKRNTKRG